jgi:hypothetical protein
MDIKKLLFGILILLMAGAVFGSPAGAKMYKEVAIGVMSNAPSHAEGDWYYMRYHGPEVARISGPWMARYQLWMPYEPPEDAVKRFGAVRGRYAELWFREDDYADRPLLKGATMPPWGTDNTRENKQTVVMVPANPTEWFYDSDPHPEDTSILRWVTIFRYPDGVSKEAGDKWFLETHAKEAVKQPGLLRFVGHRVAHLKDGAMMNMPDMEGLDPDMTPGMPGGQSWAWVCEYWYKDFDAWRKAVLDSPPPYTTPSWGGEYPFVEMRSTFIPYYHDVDFLKGTYQVDFDRPKVTYTTSP